MTDRPNPARLIDRMTGARVLCVGDVMLDRYVDGSVERISPEAPIPVLRIEAQRAMLGGAGNVAANLAALGGTGKFVALIGDDDTGNDVAQLLQELPGITPDLVVSPGRHTTLKTRFVGAGQQLIRADRESTTDLDDEARTAFTARIIQSLPGHDALILSDYGKGALNAATIKAVIQHAKAEKAFVIVDPKGTDYARYRGADVITPNKKELAEAANLPVHTNAQVVVACEFLIASCGLGGVLATRSADGMTLVRAGQEAVHFTAQAREVFDVSGAGDTVVSSLALALASGAAWNDAAALANTAAGIVVGKAGTATVSTAELAHALHHRHMDAAEAKIVPLDPASATVATWRGQGLSIGFTNGCFDLLHPGHISLFTQARATCDRLIVGVNADASVKRLKGDGRPVQTEASRAAILGALAVVDLVVIFSEDTPLRLIETLKPDVLIKGADYTVDTVVGADIVQAYGGKVVLADLKDGHSTTSTIERLNNNTCVDL